MAHDPTANIYVPTVCTLMIFKNEYLFSAVLHEIFVLLEYSWEPKLIVLDFEKALQNFGKMSIQIMKIGRMLFSFLAGDSKKNQEIKSFQGSRNYMIKLIEKYCK
ncbi:hypothetical protein MXB_1717 [Myxobolus squamalis]|nr:hypothetical protein MXB_1717 [Myxobolus squamalis]